MPRYFFHVTRDGSSVDDSEGIELPDRTAAWVGATGAMVEFIREFNAELETGTALQVDAHDQDGPLFRICFRADILR
ncbi:DUF6894 family protein [Allomesorhizobium camelthorni]|uniref:DUF6894 domain-containing protein n=1 Tax=Allomesorhizobium camelthorni TaxID=475069 RepID=A0A6G4WK48_9HYPH|nr:hypothetical protein [Mesorhizobium camelthorni]NGO54994.1 hypothetical protein [Mesorhizobium camelthorni]